MRKKPLGIPRLFDPTYARASDVLLGKVDPVAFASERARPRLMNKHLVSGEKTPPQYGAVRRSHKSHVDVGNSATSQVVQRQARRSVYCVRDGRASRRPTSRQKGGD